MKDEVKKELIALAQLGHEDAQTAANDITRLYSLAYNDGMSVRDCVDCILDLVSAGL